MASLYTTVTVFQLTFLVILMWRIPKIMKTKQKFGILFNYRGACDEFMWKSDMSWIHKYVWMRVYPWIVYMFDLSTFIPWSEKISHVAWLKTNERMKCTQAHKSHNYIDCHFNILVLDKNWGQLFTFAWLVKCRRLI